MKLRLGLAAILAASTLFGGTYNVDTSHSNVGFKVKHLMISNITGAFDKFAGSFEYDDKTKQITKLFGKIDVSSINTENAKRDGHLKSGDFFAADKFPKITFKLLKIDGDEAIGELTLRGVTKTVVLDFENNGSVVDPWGNKRVGLELNGKINRNDFGLTWNKNLDAGGVLVGDTVKLNIELEGILAK